jgi:glycine/D-amino acid oxidase-like deaminating enzyme
LSGIEQWVSVSKRRVCTIQYSVLWDQQVRKERFSSPAFTARQQAYGRRFNVESIYTPQMVVDGRSEFVGSDAMKEYPYWWDTVPPADAKASESELPLQRIDVAVIGAGYTGLAAARQLARAGAVVAVIERERVGWGASSRNAGQVVTGLKLDPRTLVTRYGQRRAALLFDAAREAIDRLDAVIAEHSIDCEYERVGHLQAAWKPSHFTAFRDEQALLARVFQHRVELIPRREQRTELGSDAYYGVLVDERSGALNPAQYVDGLAAAARRAGARFIMGTAVQRLQRESRSWIVSTTKGAVRCDDVLVATNGYTDGAAPALQRRLVPIGSYIIVTEPLLAAEATAILPRRRVAFDSKHFLYYFRLTRDRRLLFGGRAEFSQPSDDSTRRAATVLRRGLAHVFPDLAGKRIDYAWGGTVAFTRDQLPHAGTLDDLSFAGGYCGHGIAMAT